MKLSTSDLEHIKKAARNLAERLSDNNAQGEGSRSGEVSGLANGRKCRVDDDTLIRYAKKVVRTETDPQTREKQGDDPDWVYRLGEISEHVSRTFTTEKKTSVPVQMMSGDVPFKQLFWPMADFAWNRVSLAQTASTNLLTARALSGLEKYLVQRISNIASEALYPAFLAHKALAGSGLMQHFFASGVGGNFSSDPAREYTKFVLESGRDGLSSFFKSYPVAARLVSQVTGLWIDFVAEFLVRFQEDQHELAVRFNRGVPLGRVTSLQAGISDPHRGGRSVLILRLEGGLRLVYKPRPMDVDSAFYDLISGINQSVPSIDLRVLRILARVEYGWMEFAATEACSGPRAARQYYQRAGALACLAYWLQGIDFHRENIVAAGEHPVLVDLESLAHPWRAEEALSADAEPTRSLAKSVLRTGLLPLWQNRFDGAVPYDNCGLNGPIKQRSLFPAIQWKGLNSDQLHWVLKDRYQRHSAHRAVLAGRVLVIGRYERYVVIGYNAMVDMLTGPQTDRMQKNREQICCTVRRKIKRPTFSYALLLRRSLEPALLKNGIDRSFSLLTLPCDPGDERDWMEEIAELETLDIPYFHVAGIGQNKGDRALFTPDRADFVRQRALVRSSVKYRLALSKGEICSVEAFRNEPHH